MSLSFRSRNKDKNRRNYVDDALENLEAQNSELTETLENTAKAQELIKERLQLMEDENQHLRNMLDGKIERKKEDSTVTDLAAFCRDSLCQYGVETTHSLRSAGSDGPPWHHQGLEMTDF
jgi:regulator of replication initiation timing